MALLFACAAGCNVFVTSGDEEKLKKAKALGAKGGVNYKDKDWDKKLKEMLTLVLDNHNSLQNHVRKLMQDRDLLASSPNKRKSRECEECNTSDSTKNHQEGLLKRAINGVTRVYARTDPSDKSLVLYTPSYEVNLKS